MSTRRAKTLIPDFSNEKFRDAIRRSSPQELADLADAFGFDFDTAAYVKSRNVSEKLEESLSFKPHSNSKTLYGVETVSKNLSTPHISLDTTLSDLSNLVCSLPPNEAFFTDTGTTVMSTFDTSIQEYQRAA